MKKIEFAPNSRVCCRQMDITVDNGRVEEVIFHGGCHGNSQGIAALVRGMEVSDVIARLQQVQCGNRGTSCPAELARALSEL